MARIAGVDLPRDKRVEIGLTYIFGIGLTLSREILNKTGISPDVRVRELTEDDVANIRNALADYKVEGDTVYLKLRAPRVDLYQYEVQASYQRNNQAFFQGIVEEAQKVAQTDFTKALLYKFIYRLAAVGFRGDGYVNLEGMDYYDRNEHYLAIKVDDKGNATIDDKNLVNLLQIDMKPANEANKAKFE